MSTIPGSISTSLQERRNTVSGQLEIAILNRQQKIRVNEDSLQELLQRVWHIHPAATAGADYSITVCLVSDRRMRALNSEYRNRDATTDVLSFCDGEADPDGFATPLGDIVVSVETAQRQAEARGVTCGRELQTLTLHGYLHLLGYDHENDNGDMMRLQSQLERELIDTLRSGEVS